MPRPDLLLGGYQTDLRRNLEPKLARGSAPRIGARRPRRRPPRAVRRGTARRNFAGELFTAGQLGASVIEAAPRWRLPTRFRAACARERGSTASRLSRAGRYDVALAGVDYAQRTASTRSRAGRGVVPREPKSWNSPGLRSSAAWATRTPPLRPPGLHLNGDARQNFETPVANLSPAPWLALRGRRLRRRRGPQPGRGRPLRSRIAAGDGRQAAYFSPLIASPGNGPVQEPSLDAVPRIAGFGHHRSRLMSRSSSPAELRLVSQFGHDHDASPRPVLAVSPWP